MSSGGGGSSSSSSSNNPPGKVVNGVSSIPAASRKMVQNLKEIVNCPDHEIYAMLKECNMDPNETVNRLLSQDPFLEVKSKREKKKEVKESTESRSRGASGALNRGSRGGTDRNFVRSGSVQYSSNESGSMRSKAGYKKENGASANLNSSLTSAAAGQNMSRKSMSQSESVQAEGTVQPICTPDNIPMSSQSSSGFQLSWVGAPGQISMADIVRMGRPKVSSAPVAANETSYPHHTCDVSNASQHIVKNPPTSRRLPPEPLHDLNSTEDLASQVSETILEQDVSISQHVSHDEWPFVEQPSATSGSSVADPAAASAYADPSSSSNVHVNRTDLHLNSQLDEVQFTEEVANFKRDSSDRQLQQDNSGGASHFDDSLFEKSSYQPQRLAFEHPEGMGGSLHMSVSEFSVPSSLEDDGVAVSSAAASLQQLSLQKGEESSCVAEGSPAVIIPDHLQVPTADCSHLSFGSFGSGINPKFSGSLGSNTLKNNLGEPHVAAESSSAQYADTRNGEFYGNEQLRPASNENADEPSSSQADSIKHDALVQVAREQQYSFPSGPGYSFENATQANTAGYSYPQTNPQMQNLAPFSSVMAFANSLPSNFLASSVQSVRESDISNSAFVGTQSMPLKYSSAVSNISGSTISVPEIGKPGVFSTPQPALQTLPSTSIPPGHSLPQHIPVHPYPQPAHLGHFANMITYPFLPSYPYVPSGFQQAYAGNSAFHQSPAAVPGGLKYTHPQYKNSVSVSSLPQSASVASGYGGLGSSSNLPGNFMLNPSSATPSSTTGYEDVISQYKDSSHFLSLQQQNDGPAMWVHGPGSRTTSSVPGSAYYSLQGQNQQSGYRQGQQPAHYGTLGYTNFYHSQTGVAQEHQQTSSDGAHSSSQGPPSQHLHQLWQQSY